ncbi:hypothetical protein NDU88_002109 [Pleurodeles waltl]|uniref:Uncharacterized protein n=1 Tax=Pleurodeles waltl TaxID=8319 RepID=A0AAV7SBR6_PLEWA|nr:hypothetical protein NDU88_002109 [Pleurodeles waltl]
MQGLITFEGLLPGPVPVGTAGHALVVRSRHRPLSKERLRELLAISGIRQCLLFAAGKERTLLGRNDVEATLDLKLEAYWRGPGWLPPLPHGTAGAGIESLGSGQALDCNWTDWGRDV